MARTEDFNDGYGSAREPQFSTVQTLANRHFTATSVLDNIIPNQNGMGEMDLQRRMVGSRGSVSGRSPSTFDRQLWLRHPDTTARTLEGQHNG